MGTRSEDASRAVARRSGMRLGTIAAAATAKTSRRVGVRNVDMMVILLRSLQNRGSINSLKLPISLDRKSAMVQLGARPHLVAVGAR